jgi:hypothetical protein
MSRKRYTPEDLHARLIVIVGVIMAIALMGMIGVILYGLLFTTQPLTKQSPNDEAAWSVISSTVPYLVGAMSGLVASNGLKSKPKPPTSQDISDDLK